MLVTQVVAKPDVTLDDGTVTVESLLDDTLEMEVGVTKIKCFTRVGVPLLLAVAVESEAVTVETPPATGTFGMTVIMLARTVVVTMGLETSEFKVMVSTTLVCVTITLETGTKGVADEATRVVDDAGASPLNVVATTTLVIVDTP
jgi:hypothetical protein